MIQFFRVSELQSLLESVSANKLGRKIELQNRVIDLLKTNMTSSIKEKIREIYNQALVFEFSFTLICLIVLLFLTELKISLDKDAVQVPSQFQTHSLPQLHRQLLLEGLR